MERVRPGMAVMSLDGQHLGKVASADGDAIRVDAGRHGRLDVPAAEVGSVLEREVFLRLALRRYLARLAASTNMEG